MAIQGVQDLTVDTVNEVTRRVIMQNRDTEDDADAFDYIGTLWKYIGAKTLHHIYRTDGDPEVRDNMNDMLEKAAVEADEAISGLTVFKVL